VALARPARRIFTLAASAKQLVGTWEVTSTATFNALYTTGATAFAQFDLN